MRVLLLRIMVALAALYAGFTLMAWLTADKAIFQPHPSSYRDSESIIKLATAAGTRISAVYLANPSAQYTLLVSHGNAEDIGDDQPWLEELRGAGFNVFAYDYEGYGTSEGSPTEAAAYRDEQAAYDYLTKQLKLVPQQIVLYGRSVGGGPAVWLAAQEPVAGLVAQSTFLSAFRVVTRVPLLPFDRFPNYKYIRDVHCPVLIMHGGSDRVIAKANGEKLYELANPPKRSLWVEGADHNDFTYVAGRRYLDALRDFAASLQPHHG